MKNDLDLPLPRARTEKLIIKELPDETLVYDRETDRAHCLNDSAARIWKNCNGERTVKQLRELMSDETGSPVSEEIVLLGLEQLNRFQLLEKPFAQHFPLASIKRRELVRRLGMGTLAVPMILAITAPVAAQVGSPGTVGHCCINDVDCIPPLTCKSSPTPCLTPPPAHPSAKACLP